MDVFTQEVREDSDILAVRDRARVISEELGYDVTQQLQISTAVFELAKCILDDKKGGTITFSIVSEDDSLSLEITGLDENIHMTPSEKDELLAGSGDSTALRGVTAIKRLMDSFDIDNESDKGTIYHLTKRKSQGTNQLARNIVSFLNKRFSNRPDPTVSDEVNQQNQNLLQTLSLYEETNQKLKAANKELLRLKQELESSNQELQDRSTELQETVLDLGDRTSEVEAQNRRLSAVLEIIQQGVLVTDRSGEVTHANQLFLDTFSRRKDEVVGLMKSDLYKIIAPSTGLSETEWAQFQSRLEKEPKLPYELAYTSGSSRESICRISPILDKDERFLGRIWLFE